MATRKHTAAAPLNAGGTHGFDEARTGREVRYVGGPNGADHSARGVRDPAQLVAGGGVPAAGPAVRPHPAGCGAGERAESLRRAAGDVGDVARQLIVRSASAAYFCTRRLPLNESIDLSIDERIYAGDLEAIHDMAREAIADLEALADLAASLLCDEPETLKRLSEVRARQAATGRQWHRIENTDAGSTDRAGKEPRGPRRGQERTRQAKGGKPANTRRRSC